MELHQNAYRSTECVYGWGVEALVELTTTKKDWGKFSGATTDPFNVVVDVLRNNTEVERAREISMNGERLTVFGQYKKEIHYGYHSHLRGSNW